MNRLSSRIFRTVWCNTNMFHLKLLIRFPLLFNCRSNWLACRWVFRIGWFCVEAKQISGLVPLRSSELLCVDYIAIFLSQHTFWHGRWDHSPLIRSQILIRLCFIDKDRPREVKQSKYNVILHLADDFLISLMADIIKDKFRSGAHRKVSRGYHTSKVFCYTSNNQRYRSKKNGKLMQTNQNPRATR